MANLPSLVALFWQRTRRSGAVTLRVCLALAMCLFLLPWFVRAQSALPAAPANFSVSTVSGSTRINLSWSTVSGATSYKVLRSKVSGNYTTADTKTVTTTSTSTTQTVGTTYFYVVRAINSAGEGANSMEVQVTAGALPPPTNFTASTVSGSTRVNLSWSAVSGATSYKVLRSTVSGNYTSAETKTVATTSTTTTQAIGTTYFYVVRSIDSVGESTNSTQISVTAGTASATATSAPTATTKPTSTATTKPTATPTNTPKATATPTNTPKPTATPTNTPLPTATPTNTPRPTATPTATPVPTGTTIVDLATTYINSLSTAQQAATVVSSTATYAAKWSNLPATPASDGTNNLRNGVSYSTLTTAQQTAWVNLVQAALSANSSNGYNQETQIRASDNYLGSLRSGYSGDYQYVAFVGTPSTSGSWMLQVGGHHNAHNYYYTGNTLQTTTPYFLGVEPTSFTYNGTSYTPLSAQRNGMYNLINSLNSTQLASAKLSSNFSDVYLGPGKDARSNFPTGTTGRGLLASNLTSTQQALVTTAISAWTNNSPLASTYNSLYASELSQTYVAYSGTTTFNSQGDYVRIDGPHVWIEFICQNGVVISNQIHFHTIWRDRVTDYNAAYGFSSADATRSKSSGSAVLANYEPNDTTPLNPTERVVMTVASAATSAVKWVLDVVHSV